MGDEHVVAVEEELLHVDVVLRNRKLINPSIRLEGVQLLTRRVFLRLAGRERA